MGCSPWGREESDLTQRLSRAHSAGGSRGKELPAKRESRDVGSVPELGRSAGGGHGNPLQHSCPENPMDKGAWWATVHRVAKS